MKTLKTILITLLTLTIALFGVGCEFPTSHTHTYKWYTAIQATCEKEGQMEGICEECGYKIYTTIEKSSHEYSWTIQKTPTCKEEGFTVGYCINCYNKAEKVINKIEHQYDEMNICKECGIIKEAIYLKENEKLGFTLAEIDNVAYDKGFRTPNLVSNYIKGRNISLSVNKDNNVITNISSFTFSIGDVREDFVIEDGETAKIATLNYTTNNSLYVIYVDGSRVLVSNQVTNDMSIAINMQNELLIVMSDRRVVKFGTLPEVIVELDNSVLIYELSNDCSYYTLCGAVDKNITELVIPESHKGIPIKMISEGAFKGYNNLKTVKLNSSIYRIAKYAFGNCISLEKIVIPSTVQYINDFAFINCNNLTIYCEANYKPSFWFVWWNYTNCPVVWGYNGN